MKEREEGMLCWCRHIFSSYPTDGSCLFKAGGNPESRKGEEKNGNREKKEKKKKKEARKIKGKKKKGKKKKEKERKGKKKKEKEN